MAIDTESKRRSAGPQLPYFIVGPIPDGGIGGQDRRHIAGIYCAILVVASGFVKTMEVIAQFSTKTIDAIAQFSTKTIEARII